MSLTREEVANAVAKGVAERKAKHWKELDIERTKMEKRVECCNTAEKIKSLDEVISELNQHHHHRRDKNIEYKHYEDAEYNDDYIEMCGDIWEKIYDKKKELGLI